jgi:microcystin synthetase protein McyA
VILKQHFSKNVDNFINSYGPTEITIASNFKILKENDYFKNIGKPIYNFKNYILNKNLNPVPIGIIGELYIGGEGLSRGYLNNEKLTNENFILNPFENNNSKLYKTGDLARYLKNGYIEYIGRIDNQIKLRGLRIELGEIEFEI